MTLILIWLEHMSSHVQDTLVGPSFAGDGNKWLSNPQATLMGMYNGNMSSVLIQLDA